MQKTYSQAWLDYELIDAGNEKKLERWGDIITIRPEVNAYFTSALPESEWLQKAHFKFIETTKTSGSWKILKTVQKMDWLISFKQLKLNLHLTQFKHLGIFPEQRVNWDFIADNLSAGERFLNLFAYTGVSSLVARQQGAEVYHCDSVKQIIGWAKENMLSSNLEDVHWVLEDALKFAQREVKRGRKYQGIIMDPPAFGIGANKQRWKIENKFPKLLESALALKEKDGFIIANTYSPRLPARKIREITKELTTHQKVEVTDLCVKTTTGKRLDYGQRTVITA